MTESPSAGLALSGSWTNIKHQPATSDLEPKSTPEIGSAISLNSSQNDSLNSQDTAFSMSQGTSLSFQDDPKPVIGTSARERPFIEGAGQGPERMTEGSHREAGRNRHLNSREVKGTISAQNGSLHATEARANGDQHTWPSAIKKSMVGNAPHRLDTTVGSKRTASGHVKTPSLSASPYEGTSPGYSRLVNGSPQRSPQRSPQISQLTSQLRTRLSYAMVKVQKGWESKNINEIESLTAQQASPTAAAQVQGEHGSPSTVGASPERPVFTYSDVRTKLSPRGGSVLLKGRLSPGGLSSSSSSSSNTESLRASVERCKQVLNSPRHTGPSLAPPVDLSPRNPRRSNPAAFEAPKLAGNDVRSASNLSASSIPSSKSVMTATPPTSASQQKASAMEQDAIETLLFMSSPGNSQYRPSSQPLSTGSPLRPVLSPGKRAKFHTLALNKAAQLGNDDVVPLSPRKKNFLDNVNLENSENIDRVLDRMTAQANSSSDEEESIISVAPSR